MSDINDTLSIIDERHVDDDDAYIEIATWCIHKYRGTILDDTKVTDVDVIVAAAVKPHVYDITVTIKA